MVLTMLSSVTWVWKVSNTRAVPWGLFSSKWVMYLLKKCNVQVFFFLGNVHCCRKEFKRKWVTYSTYPPEQTAESKSGLKYYLFISGSRRSYYKKYIHLPNYIWAWLVDITVVSYELPTYVHYISSRHLPIICLMVQHCRKYLLNMVKVRWCIDCLVKH